MSTSQAIDPDKLEATVEQVFGYLGGAVISSMIYLGDHLGLYRALADADRALTSEELATRTGLHERWVREWLRGQAAAHLIDYQGEGRFALSPEGKMVLADEHSPAFAAGGFCGLPQQFAVLERLPEAFRTGRGLPYDAFGVEGNRGVERMFAPWFRTMLVPIALPRSTASWPSSTQAQRWPTSAAAPASRSSRWRRPIRARSSTATRSRSTR